MGDADVASVAIVMWACLWGSFATMLVFGVLRVHKDIQNRRYRQ